MSQFTFTQERVSGEVREVILKELAAAEEPITATRLRERLRGQYRLPDDQLADLLEEEVAQQRVYRFEPYGGKKRRYWTRPLDDYARIFIARLVSQRPLTRSEIRARTKAALRGCSDARQTDLLKRLVEEKQIRELPAVVGGRTKPYSAAPPDPRDYLEDAIVKIVKKLAEHGVTRESVLAAAVELVGAEAPPPAAGVEEKPALEPEELILHCAAGYDGAVEGAPVTMKELRQGVGERLTKDEFDRAVLSLHSRGSVYLHQHDQPLGLSEEDRGQLVRARDGRCFVSLVLKDRN
jgi:hypothetical protein